MSDKQKTLASEYKLNGVGLHTGKQVSMTLKPAPVNTGFVFIRTDLEGTPHIEADANYVTSTERGTTIEKKGVRIHTTEHLLAALTGMDLDNVYIEIDNSEVPILDGSSKFFVEAIEKAGIVEQDEDREYYVVKDIITFTDPETGSEITAIPSDEYQVTTMLDFGSNVLGNQKASIKSLSEFIDQIFKSWRFICLNELKDILDERLVNGGGSSKRRVAGDT